MYKVNDNKVFYVNDGRRVEGLFGFILGYDKQIATILKHGDMSSQEIQSFKVIMSRIEPHVISINENNFPGSIRDLVDLVNFMIEHTVNEYVANFAESIVKNDSKQYDEMVAKMIKVQRSGR